EGPIALDLAVSKEAAKIKKFNSPVAGDADLLLVHNIEMGNGIGKSITYFGNGIGAGVVMGAKVPIVLVSRSDDFDAKYYSILFGSAIS
ncbi:MAG: phosphate butyryltransferase, partial [Tissierellales bacterium]|nr:phosphate butyryltransferase [Tissierellales bacterium]